MLPAPPGVPSVHGKRTAPPRTAAVRRRRAIAREVTARAHALEVLAGKKVLEVRPQVGWGKGEAAALLRNVLAKSPGRASPVTLYLGDDETDEAAFRALRGRAFCVLVGRRRSRASYRLRDAAAVGDLLAWPGNFLEGTTGRQAVRCTRRER